MTRFTISPLTVTLALLATGRPAGASLIPTSWHLETGVRQTAADGFTEQVFQFNTAVETPFFNLSHTAALGPSFSTAQYAFNIGQTIADYVVNVQHRCVNHQNGAFPANPNCSSFGRIRLIPSVDVLLTADMNFSYFLPSDPVSVGIGFNVALLEPSQSLLQTGDFDSTDLSGPHGGTLALNGLSVVLPAGRLASVQYTLRTTYHNGSAFGLLATGDGIVHLTMTALPEPAALGSLVLAALLFRKRRVRDFA